MVSTYACMYKFQNINISAKYRQLNWLEFKFNNSENNIFFCSCSIYSLTLQRYLMSYNSFAWPYAMRIHIIDNFVVRRILLVFSLEYCSRIYSHIHTNVIDIQICLNTHFFWNQIACNKKNTIEFCAAFILHLIILINLVLVSNIQR